ncbi:hypothetical protein [Streptomyces sp. NPDC013455]|uniref:hypothetical protein n=1 Tax=Streptomyces sp. NPDC013455 TaxID=3155605 RepID=UPI0034105D58
MGSETGVEDGIGALLPELARTRATVIVAPQGTVNTGEVHGGQRTVLSGPAVPDGRDVALVRQGPVRAKDLRAARECFARPAGYAEGLDALDSGVLFVLGAPGTGRQTLALSLLAHGCADPALVQVDGRVELAHWRPRARGADGYLVMDLSDPLALRSWDVADLEAHLARAGARLVVVLEEAPGLARALEDRLGVRVLRHRPPDPREVFSAHFADLCPDPRERARRRRRLGPDALAALLPPGLPPGRAVQVAEALARSAPDGRVRPAELTARLARTEATRLLAGAEGDPGRTALLFAVCVHEGLDRDTVLGRAAALLGVIGAQRDSVGTIGAERVPLGATGAQQHPAGAIGARQHPVGTIGAPPVPLGAIGSQGDPGASPPTPPQEGSAGRPVLALPRFAGDFAPDGAPAPLGAVAAGRLADVGARCTVPEDGDRIGTVSFLWPAVSEAVWDEVCRERAEWLPALHVWLGAAGNEEQAERAGRAVAALAVRTAGRSLELLGNLLRAGPRTAAEVAGRALAAAAGRPPAAGRARTLLDEWSGAPDHTVRSAVVVACRPEAEGLPAEAALRLLRRVVDALGDDEDAAATALQVSGTLVLRFAAGAGGTREAIVRELAAWAHAEDLAGALATLVFPALVTEDWGWFGDRLAAGREAADPVVALVCAALDEAAVFPAMRDALLMWCAGAAGAAERERQLDALFARLVAGRRPGCLRLLMSVERAARTTPGKARAERSLAEWRGGPGTAAAGRPA